MSKRSDHGGITFQAGKGFKKCVGWYQHADGRKLPKIHWLGHDAEHARFVVFGIQKVWRRISLGGGGWTPQDLADVKVFIANGDAILREPTEQIAAERKRLDAWEHDIREIAAITLKAAAVALVPRSAPPVEQKSPTLYGAINAYLDSLKTKRVSEGHRERATQILEVNLKRARKDCPLTAIDFAWLVTLADHYRNRPASLKEKDKQISASTAALILRYLKAFFVWVDDSTWGGWEGPRKLTKAFRCSISEMMTSAELRESTTIKQFDVDTLRKLYVAGNDFTRRCMLLGLFTGATQQELSVLEKSEFDLDAGTLHHFRNKTRVEGRYWLPPEAVELLRADFAKRPKDKLAFRTEDGHTLVTFANGRKTSDTVRQAWDDLRDNAELPGALSFKYLRKYLADWMTRRGGEEMGMVALSHTRQTVLAKSYTRARQFDRFAELQRQMYEEFKAAKMFDLPVKKKAKANAEAETKAKAAA